MATADLVIHAVQSVLACIPGGMDNGQTPENIADYVAILKYLRSAYPLKTSGFHWILKAFRDTCMSFNDALCMMGIGDPDEGGNTTTHASLHVRLAREIFIESTENCAVPFPFETAWALFADDHKDTLRALMHVPIAVANDTSKLVYVKATPVKKRKLADEPVHDDDGDAADNPAKRRPKFILSDVDANCFNKRMQHIATLADRVDMCMLDKASSFLCHNPVCGFCKHFENFVACKSTQAIDPELIQFIQHTENGCNKSPKSLHDNMYLLLNEIKAKRLSMDTNMLDEDAHMLAHTVLPNGKIVKARERVKRYGPRLLVISAQLLKVVRSIKSEAYTSTNIIEQLVEYKKACISDAAEKAILNKAFRALCAFMEDPLAWASFIANPVHTDASKASPDETTMANVKQMFSFVFTSGRNANTAVNDFNLVECA